MHRFTRHRSCYRVIDGEGNPAVKVCLILQYGPSPAVGVLMPKTALLIGAGPAGLTAALEFLRRSDVHPIVLEASHEIGGISRTIRHNGNRIDIGGHRFFS